MEMFQHSFHVKIQYKGYEKRKKNIPFEFLSININFEKEIESAILFTRFVRKLSFDFFSYPTQYIVNLPFSRYNLVCLTYILDSHRMNKIQIHFRADLESRHTNQIGFKTKIELLKEYLFSSTDWSKCTNNMGCCSPLKYKTSKFKNI